MGRHAGPQLTAPGARNNASCPSQYFVCVEISKGKTQQGICISSSGNCTSGLVGNWNWSSKIVSVKTGKKTKKVKESFSPNPGNPTTITFKAKKVKNSKGKIVYDDQIMACSVTNPSSCITGDIGISTK